VKDIVAMLSEPSTRTPLLGLKIGRRNGSTSGDVTLFELSPAAAAYQASEDLRSHGRFR
jgi:hypothetical protein